MNADILNAAADVVHAAGYHACAVEIRSGRRAGENLVFACKGMCRNGQAAQAARLLSLCQPHGLCSVVDVRHAEAVRDKYRGAPRTQGGAINIFDL